MAVRLLAVGSALALLASVLWFIQPRDTFALGECPHAGFILYENGYPFSGDSTKICATSLLQPTSAARNNFDVNPGPGDLINGCAAGIGTHSTWNDCVSGIKLVNLGANYKVVLYLNSGYGTTVWCGDTNGTHSYSLSGLANDNASSGRILAGDC